MSSIFICLFCSPLLCGCFAPIKAPAAAAERLFWMLWIIRVCEYFGPFRKVVKQFIIKCCANYKRKCVPITFGVCVMHRTYANMLWKYSNLCCCYCCWCCENQTTCCLDICFHQCEYECYVHCVPDLLPLLNSFLPLFASSLGADPPSSILSTRSTLQNTNIDTNWCVKEQFIFYWRKMYEKSGDIAGQKP